MKFTPIFISNYRKIISSVSQHVDHLPPRTKYRLLFWLLHETFLHKPGLPSVDKNLPRRVQSQIERLASRFMGYMVIFAHDDAVDKFDLDSRQLYEQLSRYLISFIIGLSTDEQSATVGEISRHLDLWSSKLNCILSDSPNIVSELHHLLTLPTTLDELTDEDSIKIQHLLYKDEYDELCQDWINSSIVSAMGMGQAFREILMILAKHLDESDATQQKRIEFFMGILVKCMYGQAHSPEQKKVGLIPYGRFVEMSIMKSTLLFDLYNYVSDQVNEERFFATRHNAARICNQIVDDLQDFEEDTKDQILNLLHMHVLEQGKIAEKYLSAPVKQRTTITFAKGLVSETEILRTSVAGSFVYHNPYIQAPRDSNGNLCLDPDDSETILREIWVSSPKEINWPLDELARHRLSLSSDLEDAWQSKAHATILDTVYRSNFPIALLESHLSFNAHHKYMYIDIYRQYGALLAGYVGYFVPDYGLRILLLKYRSKKMFRVLVDPLTMLFGNR